jgi:hypothetical protein
VSQGDQGDTEAEAEAETGATETTVAEGDAVEPVTAADEPINRGLLLKFLSSVRS